MSSPQEARSVDAFLDAAIAEAEQGLAEGGIPIGAVLVHRGAVIGRGPTDVYAIGFDGTTIRFDGGEWTSRPKVTSSFLLGLATGASGGPLLRAVGTNLTILEAVR